MRVSVRTISWFLIALMALPLLVDCGGKGPSKDTAREQLTMRRRMVETARNQVDSDDKEAQAIIDECETRLNSVQDLIIEDELDKALVILEEVGALLKPYQPNQIKETPDKDSLFKIYGRVSYKGQGQDAFVRLEGHETLESIAAIQTGIRSAVRVTLPTSPRSSCPPRPNSTLTSTRGIIASKWTWSRAA